MLIELKLFGVSVVRLKCIADDNIDVYLNGKRKTHSGGVSIDSLKMLVASLKGDISQSYMLAYICGDAKDCAIVCALLNILPFAQNSAYFGAGKDKFDIDVRAMLTVNLVEIVSIVITLIDRRKNAKF